MGWALVAVVVMEASVGAAGINESLAGPGVGLAMVGAEVSARTFPGHLFLNFRSFGFEARDATEKPCLLNGREVLRSISFEP